MRSHAGSQHSYTNLAFEVYFSVSLLGTTCEHVTNRSYDQTQLSTDVTEAKTTVLTTPELHAYIPPMCRTVMRPWLFRPPVFRRPEQRGTIHAHTYTYTHILADAVRATRKLLRKHDFIPTVRLFTGLPFQRSERSTRTVHRHSQHSRWLVLFNADIPSHLMPGDVGLYRSKRSSAN